ncbi:hypothetical protein [Autumnicola musiva]|uniref:Uncharacterized protein n=1 Tax=Autumnicola musiva TaxID=3075589 RepID=A0ABU3DB66_9FLAO|nr:hypothetical protein [Zunongwangia sp. F117]MDT0678781.1 hypothetical protein [Zunongwangia sp. F117]
MAQFVSSLEEELEVLQKAQRATGWWLFFRRETNKLPNAKPK